MSISHLIALLLIYRNSALSFKYDVLDNGSVACLIALEEDNLIEDVAPEKHNEYTNKWALTSRGQAMVAHLASQPLPTAKVTWVFEYPTEGLLTS